MDHREILQRILRKEITPQEIIDDCLAIFICRGDPEPDENTIVDPELIELIVENMKKHGDIGKYPAWFDHEANVIRGGFNFRNPDESTS